MKSGVLAVVELFAPVFDPAGPTVTYEVVVLANWEDSTELGFAAAPSDLAAVGPSFGAAHLFIDGCPNQRVGCVTPEHRLAGSIPASAFGGFDWHAQDVICLPHEPSFATTPRPSPTGGISAIPGSPTSATVPVSPSSTSFEAVRPNGRTTAMDASRFDAVSTFLASRRLSRQALAQGGAGRTNGKDFRTP